MRTLRILCRGDYYDINEQGHTTRLDIPGFKPSRAWLFVGVSFHHWRRSPDIRLWDAFKNPAALVGGLVWDIDHGTLRQWGGRYNGGLPRVQAAYVIEGKDTL